MYIDGNFAINLIHPNYLSILLTDKIRIGMTGRAVSKIFVRGA